MSTDLRLSRVKKNVADEATALAQVVDKTGIAAENLIADHTEGMWRWKEAQGGLNFEVDGQSTPVFSVAKADVEDENAAARMAMDHFQTIENNLSADHSDTDYIFAQIRG